MNSQQRLLHNIFSFVAGPAQTPKLTPCMGPKQRRKLRQKGTICLLVAFRDAIPQAAQVTFGFFHLFVGVER